MTTVRTLPALPLSTPGDELPSSTVIAHNASLHSDNKIHDDEVAKKYGFAGGLVPGVTVYAHMVAPLAEALGERWLTIGTATVAFVQPLYEQQMAVSRATVLEVNSGESGDAVAFDIRTENSAGERCGTGTATVTSKPARGPVEVPDYVNVDPGSPPDPRPDLRLETASVGTVLARLVAPTTAEVARDYAQNVFDNNGLFTESSIWGPPLMHPGWLLSECNRIFTQSYSFGPWIHTRSQIRYLGPALAGRTFTFHGRLAEVYERRLHHYAVLDIFCIDDHGRQVMQVQHTAIFKVHPKT